MMPLEVLKTVYKPTTDLQVSGRDICMMCLLHFEMEGTQQHCSCSKCEHGLEIGVVVSGCWCFEYWQTKVQHLISVLPLSGGRGGFQTDRQAATCCYCPHFMILLHCFEGDLLGTPLNCASEKTVALGQPSLCIHYVLLDLSEIISCCILHFVLTMVQAQEQCRTGHNA